MPFALRREIKVVLFLAFSTGILLQFYYASRSWVTNQLPNDQLSSKPLDSKVLGPLSSVLTLTSSTSSSASTFSSVSTLATSTKTTTSSSIHQSSETKVSLPQASGTIVSSLSQANGTLASSLSPANGTIASPLSCAIVSPSLLGQDMTWLDALADQWTLHIYNVDDPSSTPHVPSNKGHEAMVYLTFIIDHYDTSLPAYTVFIHGHATSWHQENDIVPLIRSLRLPALQAAGYVPLRCDWYPSCAAELKPVSHNGTVWGPGVHRADAEYAITEAWDTFFPDVQIPETIASQCCAQFAVSRDSILKRKKQEYVKLRRWLLETDLIDDVSGRVLEKLWAYIMTGEPVHCPSPNYCACTYFGRCEKQTWPEPPPGLPPLPDDSRNVENATLSSHE